ncbi:hypothetical protein M4I32_12800 [Microbacterium sp. LRZ72]|uniref:hypothetical protein n=1 Tax=Microbacterium sp. LRZ72 TaxID=2942481 RepID=UPI0029BE4869|nr:hypothetical protein [Microbacterium sp. LRZ72]MDX2377681.1 hypothetical protein [Microbacterium sp. LRZ72]
MTEKKDADGVGSEGTIPDDPKGVAAGHTGEPTTFEPEETEPEQVESDEGELEQ